MEKWEKIGFFSLVGHPRFTGRWCPSRCPRIFSQSVIVYILVLFVWTPAIYWSLVSQSQSRQNISISISSSQDPHCINVCFAIEKMINFDGDANADVKCKVAFSPRGTHERRWVFPPSCPSRCSSRDTRTCSRQSCSVPRYTRCLETGLRTGLRHKHLKIRRHQCNSRDTDWFVTSSMYFEGVT